MGEIKRRAVTTEGYVVRGKDRQGQAVTCWTEDGAAVHEVIAPRFSSPDVANTALRAMARRGCTDVGIFRVHADGREERLPSYEEALAEIERLRGVAPILLEGVPAIMHSSAPSSREEIGAAACEMLKAIERALSVLRGSEPVDPLAALEAAEQRLLEAEGWTQEPGEPTLWRSSTGHPWGPRRRLVSRDEAVSLARRAAKKGGS